MSHFDNPIRDVIAKSELYRKGYSIEELQSIYDFDSVVKLSSNENPLGPSVSLSDCLPALPAHYPDPMHHPFGHKLASHLGVSRDQVILGNGSDDLLQCIGLATLNPTDNVISAECTFLQYRFIANLMQANYTPVPLKKGGYDLVEIERCISERTKLIYIANPNNPTGTILSHDALKMFLDTVPSHTLVVLDEAYKEYVTDPNYPDALALLQRYPNLLITGTFSKIYGLAGLRIGYCYGQASIIQYLQRVRLPYNINALALNAAHRALDQHEFLKKSVAMNEDGKSYLYNALDKLGYSYIKSHANFVYVHTNQITQTADQLEVEFGKRGVSIRPMTAYGDPHAIRVTIGVREELDAFLSVLKTLP